MADKKISELPASSAITGAELVPIVQNGNTVRTTTNALVPSGTYVDTTTDQAVLGKKDFASFHVGSGRPWVDPRHKQGTSHGAIGDGVSRPLSTLYGTLTAAQADFPQATALTDELDSVAFLRAMALGREVRVADGRFVMNRQISRLATGVGVGEARQGMRLVGAGVEDTIFESRLANAHLLNLDGSGAQQSYGNDAILDGFAIEPPTASPPANSGGIRLRAQWNAYLNVRVVDVSGDCITVDNLYGDDDASFEVEFVGKLSGSTGGWGFNMKDPTAFGGQDGQGNTSAGFHIRCYITSNALGGVRMLGFQHTIRGGAIAYNKVVGLLISHTSPNNQPSNIEVIGVEMDTNDNVHIDIQAVQQMRIFRNRFLVQPHWEIPTGQPAVAIRVGKDGGAGTAHIVNVIQNTTRLDQGTLTFLDIKNNATAVYEEGTAHIYTAGITPYSDPGKVLVRREGPYVDGGADRFVTHTITADGIYSPAGGLIHRYIINSPASTVTIGAPAAALTKDGARITLLIYNGVGALTVNFNAIYRHAGFTVPAAGNFRSAEFVYDSAGGAWRMAGAWSPEYAY